MNAHYHAARGLGAERGGGACMRAMLRDVFSARDGDAHCAGRAHAPRHAADGGGLGGGALGDGLATYANAQFYVDARTAARRPPAFWRALLSFVARPPPAPRRRRARRAQLVIHVRHV